MKLQLTQAALDDLRSIRAYTLDTWGAEQEQRYLDRIWARFESLGLNPMRHRLRSDLFSGCRLATEGKHVILFRCDDGQLEVVRVLHAAMDFKRHRPPDPASSD
jgi:toxin ParE1/3/4